MTRERAGDYEDKKQLILDKAADLFARKGFDGATMVEVAQACGASKSHLYHYFGSKEDLLFAIVQEHITVQVVELERTVELQLPADERLRQFIGIFVRVAAQSRNQHLVLMNDLKFLPADKQQQVRDMELRLLRLMTSLLCEINPQLLSNTRVRAPYALMMFGMMIWSFTWYQKSGAITPDELAERMSELLVHGIQGARPPAARQPDRQRDDQAARAPVRPAIRQSSPA